MTPAAENLRVLLEARNIDGFLSALDVYRQQHSFEPVVTALTQRVFPRLLRTAFQEERLPPTSLVRLYRMVRSGKLLLVEDYLLAAINLHIDGAIREVEPATVTPVPPLITGEDVRPKAAQWSPPSAPGGQRLVATEMKRIAVVSAFTFGTWAAADAFDFRRNACASQQEREFLRAVRQFFPSLQAYPNMPVKNFIDIDKLEATVPARVRQYAWLAQVDVLLCTTEEDPVAGIELDSNFQDTEEAAERDALKNMLFKLAGLPLVRIRAEDEKAVRAEDFYDLLMAESKTLDALRPRRMRPRRTHDFLVPAESATRTSPAHMARG
ncbi:DUF2726 domain-containing protein [Delftia acidovorans]|uniref:DUF2726 domain-containing protein n=1 Tax=Delftia acidovorans TaxID=80866 RepID=A0AAJ2VCG3_DELAC|nr:DUF2726 domain-containing protein [Delftia acidovorans]MDX4956582.1 DUF2726 domain-containing protein [Delftia acidovorans]